jgi:hypothetical protein
MSEEISSQEQANVYLQREYLPEHNQRFGRMAARPEDYHRRAPRAGELDRIPRLENERTVSDDWVVRYGNRFFQLQPQSGHYAPAQGKVLVCEGRHGSMAIEYRGRALRWQQIPAPIRPRVSEPSPPSNAPAKCVGGSGSGCHPRVTRGEKPRAEAGRGKKGDISNEL